MPTLRIDDEAVPFREGETVLEAARRIGLDIPTLCYVPGRPSSTSCMACVVKVEGRRSLVPSCATLAEPGMVVQSETDTVREARRTAMELLLSDHAGDCHAPCERACPAHMDVATMLRQVASGDFEAAATTMRRDLALPAVLGRICPAPCEAGCRRKPAGGAVAVREIHGRRFFDEDSIEALPVKPATGKRVAIVGGGPTGLSAAYYLQIAGHQCTIHDPAEQLGGSLRRFVETGELDPDLLDREIDVIRRLGVTFVRGRLGESVTLDALQRQFDAVLLAVGEIDTQRFAAATDCDLQVGERGIAVDPNALTTSQPAVFAAGRCVRPSRLDVRSVGDGHTAAICIDQFLRGETIQRPDSGMNLRLPAMDSATLQSRVEQVADQGRISASADQPLQPLDAISEAQRCMTCDCAGLHDCKLRRYAEAYGADPKRFEGERSQPVGLRIEHPEVIYEPAKCISCGICVQITREAGEELGRSSCWRGSLC